jgi:hypothetical protein
VPGETAVLPFYGCGNQEFILFLADGVEPSGYAIDRNEVLEVRSQEVLEMILDNGVVDGLSLTPLAVLLLAEATVDFPEPAKSASYSATPCK